MLEILLISAGAVLETLFIMRSYKRRDASSVVLSFGKNDSPYRNAVLHVLYYMAQIFIALTIKFV